MFRPVIPASSSSLRSCPAPVIFFVLAFRSFPRSVFLFPCSGHPQSAFLAWRSGHSPRSASLFLCSGQPQSSFLSWHSGHSPRSVFLFPCSGPSQVVLAGRLFCIFWGLALTIGHKRDNFSPVPRNEGNFGHRGRNMGGMPVKPGKIREKD